MLTNQNETTIKVEFWSQQLQSGRLPNPIIIRKIRLRPSQFKTNAATLSENLKLRRKTNPIPSPKPQAKKRPYSQPASSLSSLLWKPQKFQTLRLKKKTKNHNNETKPQKSINFLDELPFLSVSHFYLVSSSLSLVDRHHYHSSVQSLAKLFCQSCPPK